jgi:hypothetical protein
MLPDLRARKADLLALLAATPSIATSTPSLDTEQWQYPGGPVPGPTATVATVAAWLEVQATAALADYALDLGTPAIAPQPEISCPDNDWQEDALGYWRPSDFYLPRP